MSSRRLALVTGAAGGLGTRIAGRLADDGYSLLLVDRDPRVSATAAGLAGASSFVADLTQEDDRLAIVDRVRVLGGLDVLVNNAGVTRDGRIANLSDADFAVVIDVNLVAVMQLSSALEGLFREDSAVVNISSRAGLGNFGQANYVASKSGLMGFTRALALQWAPRVRVNAVAPGLIDTPMTQAMPEAVLGKLVDRIPAQRIGTPDDVAAAVAYLAGPASPYVTGQTLIVCGGRSVAQ